MTVRAVLEDVSVRLGSVQALEHVDLVVEPGQFLALLGPSGSGKTTTLNVMAGFVLPDVGRITFNGLDMAGVLPNKRDLGMVFQGYALFPHMTVERNVDFPLRMRKLLRGRRRQLVREALELVGLADYGNRPIRTLSGGQKQRVAVARAIVFEPQMMLLDEPLAALDKQLRDQMQLELRRLQRRLAITTVAVTHDQVEALTMADVVAVMRAGHVEQVAPPRELYLRPATSFVATFLGEANLLPVTRAEVAGFGRLGETRDTGLAVVRPEHLRVVRSRTEGRGELYAEGRVEEVAFQGPRLRARVRLTSHPELALTVTQSSAEIEGGLKPGDQLTLAIDPRLVHVVARDIDTETESPHPSSEDARRDRGTPSHSSEHGIGKKSRLGNDDLLVPPPIPM